MPAFVHAARILPGQAEEFKRRIKEGFETGAPGLKSLGFTRVVSFVTTETAGDSGGLLVTVYEAEDASVVERFYGLQPVIENERRMHGVLVTPHDHDAVPRSAAFLDLDLTAIPAPSQG